MYRVIIVILLGVSGLSAQVGIGVTNPKAYLDVTASNPTAPTNMDGVLVPRITAFSAINPTALQNGLLVFNESTSKRIFYNWNSSTNSWIKFVERIDDLQDAKTGTSYYEWYIFLGEQAGATLTGNQNSEGIGYYALNKTTRSAVTAIGYKASMNNASGAGVIALGHQACSLGVSGANTVAIGSNSLYKFKGNHSTAVGYQSLYNYSYSSTVFSIGNNALGTEAAYNLVDGNLNDVLGYRAMYNNVSGNNNVIAGAQAGYNLKGSYNVFLGAEAGKNATNIDKCIFIGNQAGMNESNNNRLYIENSSSSTPLIGGRFDTNKVGINVDINSITHRLTVGGDVKATDYTATTGGVKYADYVFEKYYNGFSEINNDYKMLSLEEAEAFVKKNKHLPGVQSYKEIKANNFSFNETNLILKSLEKQEELFLYVTEINQNIKDTDTLIKELKLELAN